MKLQNIQSRQNTQAKPNFGKLLIKGATKRDANVLSEFALSAINHNCLPGKEHHFINTKQSSPQENFMIGIFNGLKAKKKISENVTIESVPNKITK